jgi:copper chaperone CopZ
MQHMKGNAMEVTIPVTGMSCGSCVRHVQQALNQQSGVTICSVNLQAGQAAVTFDPQETSVEELVDAIRQAGYGAEVPRKVQG